ncbi:solute carrier family 10 (sodium/bile acid cotransporter), member 7 [Formivibrio citricus]|uniref:Solute carrier family 10 (Sodium/bile acid cotransporter), member 7 n=1 Tax=Formivibrio citricus TaxID=83765 RepID=A0A1I4VZS8_9NEIS|nr:bile acid:sodium symporter family protein [Formivibrio citricus]SFN06655.1 solute carrier family 10 (sodium/bile acid cotransporter), member 7 [Formivibrio citricus]
MARSRYLPDNFTLALVATVLTATLLPCRGTTAQYFNLATHVAVGLLFFMHGAKLSREAVLSGITHWRLHLTVACCTFLLFPMLGFLLQPVLSHFVTPELYLGMLFLCLLPSTVQSSIAFTSMAKGNVPAAICSASASNILGIFITPLLVGLLLAQTQGQNGSLDSILNIVSQLLLPFIAGQIAQRWIGGWVNRNKGTLKYVDQSSVLLVVYTAFSEAVISGLWQQTPAPTLAGLLIVNVVLLAIVMTCTTLLSRKLGFGREDEIAIVFCGSKKSLVSGVPMAKVLFSGAAIGQIVLPLMLFHQIQLMVCAVMAQRYLKSAPAENQ